MICAFLNRDSVYVKAIMTKTQTSYHYGTTTKLLDTCRVIGPASNPTINLKQLKPMTHWATPYVASPQGSNYQCHKLR